MSILIKDMAMPKSCYRCPFFTQVYYLNKNDEADILSKCKRTGEFTWESVDGYLPNCPLVHVPEHGRLIDADALMAHFEKIADIEWNKKAAPISWSYAFEDVMDDIENAPTIIPADHIGDANEMVTDKEGEG